ncbi:MAG: YCF48-related protein, partial [Cyanobacteria bacterium P01_H01_bin.121]
MQDTRTHGQGWPNLEVLLTRSLSGLLLSLLVIFTTGCGSFLPSLEQNPWTLISVPTTATMSDIAFTSDPTHGWLVGSAATALETKDGGDTWEARDLGLYDDRYRFVSVSFTGDEGWIVGEPAITLHTTDGGEHWDEVLLSKQLPGEPLLITALGENTAELATTVAAIYRTTDGGQNWRALVQDAAGAVRSIERSPEGKYAAVSALGNFYSVWQPGQPVWNVHQRVSS